MEARHSKAQGLGRRAQGSKPKPCAFASVNSDGADASDEEDESETGRSFGGFGFRFVSPETMNPKSFRYKMVRPRGNWSLFVY